MSDVCDRSTAEAPNGKGFDEVVVPHLETAYRLACWLLRNEHDAEDAVQEASLRALRYFRTFTGGNGRAWFLRIVRNTCHSWRGNGRLAQTDPFDEERHSIDQRESDPETLALQRDDAKLIEAAMMAVPDRHRELLVLRELDGLSYRELADATGRPIGTVMSGLSRGRQALRKALQDQLSSRERGPLSAPGLGVNTEDNGTGHRVLCNPATQPAGTDRLQSRFLAGEGDAGSQIGAQGA